MKTKLNYLYFKALKIGFMLQRTQYGIFCFLRTDFDELNYINIHIDSDRLEILKKTTSLYWPKTILLFDTDQNSYLDFKVFFKSSKRYE